ncbi:hypothetical protein M231_01109 [Tremella mesenterica]|uniref:Uncharacterized protein n=1 Tax=Tremella mesenterica TaxID=5217 RepID=A0A4Q1BUB1_TREME|nr:hypothetical protein M231_01109 [Tremella mesenterica]
MNSPYFPPAYEGIIVSLVGGGILITGILGTIYHRRRAHRIPTVIISSTVEEGRRFVKPEIWDVMVESEFGSRFGTIYNNNLGQTSRYDRSLDNSMSGEVFEWTGKAGSRGEELWSKESEMQQERYMRTVEVKGGMSDMGKQEDEGQEINTESEKIKLRKREKENGGKKEEVNVSVNEVQSGFPSPRISNNLDEMRFEDFNPLAVSFLPDSKPTCQAQNSGIHIVRVTYLLALPQPPLSQTSSYTSEHNLIQAGSPGTHESSNMRYMGEEQDEIPEMELAMLTVPLSMTKDDESAFSDLRRKTKKSPNTRERQALGRMEREQEERENLDLVSASAYELRFL